MAEQVNQEHEKQDHQSSLAVLMFTDIVDSTGYKDRHGSAAYDEALTRHQVMFQNLISASAESRVIDAHGDEMFARFSTASSAVDAALRFQFALSRDQDLPEPLAVRIGIHMGEILEKPDGSVVGLAIDLANRVQSLAEPRQILLTRAAYDDARQFIRHHPACCDEEELPDLQWKAHGPYRIKGLEEPVDIFEVGAEGAAPLQPPQDSEKAVRAVRPDEEENYGWRPAAGLEIPGYRGWKIEEKLGEGGYGEVWLGIQQQTMRKLAFKFCFDAERVRALNMELMSHRILLKNLGERPDIAQLVDLQLDAPPFYLVSEYSADGDLTTWAKKHGGENSVPLDVRLDVFIRACRAVAAAHGVGALHRDLKPSNILIFMQDGKPRPKIADFGISVLTEKGREQASEDTYAPSVTELSGTRSTGTGSQLYIPPEQLKFPPPEFTPQGDVYALGVMLYQLVTGDLTKPLGHGWEKEVRDPELRADIARAVDADLAHRFSSPNELADRLSRLSSRRRARRVRQWSVTGLAAALVLSIAGFLYWIDHQKQTHLNQLAGIQQVWHEMMKAADPQYSGYEQSVDSVLDACISMLDSGELDDVPQAEAEARLRIGRTLIGRSAHDKAEKQIVKARDLYTKMNEPALVAATEHYLAFLYRAQERRDESEALYRKVLAERERLLGEDHPDTALTRYELSVTLRGLNELEESHDLLVRAMADAEDWLRKQKSMSEHVNVIAIETARMYNSKARLLREMGRREDAREPLDISLERRTALLGEDHRDVLRTMSTRAWLESDLENLEDAARIQQELLEKQRAILGDDHREVAGTLYWSASVLYRMGRYDEAEEYASEALQIREEQFDDNTQAVVDARAMWARIRLKQDLHDAAALDVLRTAHEMAHDVYEDDDWEYHDIAGALGEVLCELGECHDAMPLLVAANVYMKECTRSPDWRKREADNRLLRYQEQFSEAIAHEMPPAESQSTSP